MVGGMLNRLGAGVVLVASCSFSPEGLDLAADGTPTTPPPAMHAGAKPSSTSESSPPQPAATVLRAHDVEAKRLSVGVLFTNELEAKNGSVATSAPPLPAADLAAQIGEQNIEAPELIVDVLYAHHVKARVVSVRELHAADVKIDDKDDSGD
jgi:hypothetical protein